MDAAVRSGKPYWITGARAGLCVVLGNLILGAIYLFLPSDVTVGDDLSSRDKFFQLLPFLESALALIVILLSAEFTWPSPRRVARLVAGEGLKVFSHPFIYVSGVILVLATLAAARWQPLLHAQKEPDWHSFHAIQLFTFGADFGLTVASYVLVIFTSMLFAGEFDRGTVKIMLTRPVTRTDFYLSKVVTAVLLAAALYVLVLYVSFLYATLKGELGPVWDDETHLIQKSYGDLLVHARKAVLMAFLPFLAAAFMGMCISTFTESSGYAVAIALILFVVVTFVSDFRDETRYYFFNYYPSYAFRMLRLYAEGTSVRWEPHIDDRMLAIKVPLVYIEGLLAVSYAAFRSKNITV